MLLLNRRTHQALRESGQASGQTYALNGVTEGGESGVPHGDELLAFVAAAVGGSDAELDAARAALIDRIGPHAFVSAASVTAFFNGIVRIADASGIPLDPNECDTEDLQAELGVAAWHG